MSLEHSIHPLEPFDIEYKSRFEQKDGALQQLQEDHRVALKAFHEVTSQREARRAVAFQIHVSCMDERDTFACEATGEPVGAMELFASPGGEITKDRKGESGAQKLIDLYGKDIAEARAAGKEISISMMPHICGADGHFGCAAFANDMAAQEAYFSELVEAIVARPEFEGVKILTAFYDTDTHALKPFHGSELQADAKESGIALLERRGGGMADGKGEKDRAHAGNRIYVGDLPRAWIVRRNSAYQLHSGLDEEALLDGIALAVKVIQTHSHVNTAAQPIVIQVDRHVGEEFIEILRDPIELWNTLKRNSLLKDVEVDEEGIMIVYTETDPKSWEGQLLQK
ncbi:hypothetical protein IT408_04985 [Candidatus Uhrbacteria bacterium]|nr:hypothetical protein [Candidatus Uhrbacteria bacterium]